MSTDVFELHIQQSLEKLENLWQRSTEIPSPENELWQDNRELPQQQQQLLRESLAELSASIEELQVAAETLREQNDELLSSRQQIAAERKYYWELFDLAPDCYAITTKDGTIREVNQKTTELLEVSPQYLSRKSLAVFIAIDCRQEYYTKLNQLKRGEITEATWQLEIMTRQKKTISVECLVKAKSDRSGELVELRWCLTPIKTESEKPSQTNLTPILINSLRYPLYNLATQTAEIKTRNQARKLDSDRYLQSISQEILGLKHIVNNAYIFECLQDSQDLHPSLIDYQSFLNNLIEQTLPHTDLKQPIVLTSPESCVGICDVLLLEQMIINILQQNIEPISLDSPIQVRLTKPSAKYLIIQVEFLIPQTTVAEVLAVFAPLVSQDAADLTSDRDLNMAVIRKCVHLLQGQIELNSNDSSINITVKLPLILTINSRKSTEL